MTKIFGGEERMPELFDAWPEEYERWFQTPIGRLVKKFETGVVLDLLRPYPGERIVDAGCGTGIFTGDILERGAGITGLDLSLPMLRNARSKGYARLDLLQGDMRRLPFPAGVFDKTVSITALEFIEDAKQAVGELFRVTRNGGTIVAATLNRLSPWAAQRKEKGKEGHSLFSRVVFRSPEEMAALAAPSGLIRTAVHFANEEEDPCRAAEIEEEGKRRNLMTGAFLAVRWEKP
jgi:ubiquinone/menaquinone biosynthesis C-methylase UbiE